MTFRGSTRRTIAQLREAGFLPQKPQTEAKPHGNIKTHCKRGHPMVDWNLYHYPDGHRECRACRALSQPLHLSVHWAELAEWGLT